MGYAHIDNLYKNQDILLFKQCYALEKIHGTSAHITFKETIKEGTAWWTLHYFSGGAKHEQFVKLFDEELLLRLFMRLDMKKELTVYGEAYGGKEQGMSDTYGKVLKFIAFDVKLGENWLNISDAVQIANSLELEFVHNEIVSTNIDILDSLSCANSVQALRNGCGEKLREGIVLRPLIEVRKNNGERIAAKHKNDKFKERVHVPKITVGELEILTQAKAIADEWVTEMRLSHILGKREKELSEQDIGEIIKLMIEDVLREASGEIVENKEVNKAIGRKTALLIKDRLRTLK